MQYERTLLLLEDSRRIITEQENILGKDCIENVPPNMEHIIRNILGSTESKMQVQANSSQPCKEGIWLKTAVLVHLYE